MNTLAHLLAVFVLAAAAAGTARAQSYVAQVDHAGPYAVLAGGANQYDYDCYYYSDCSVVRTNAGKGVLGWRFGRYAVEGWYADFGRARLRGTSVNLRLQAVGVNAVWSLPFSPGTEGLLRAGLVDVRHQRSDDIGTQRLLTGSFGLAMVLHLSNQIAIEVGWDATSGEGINTGTTLASAITAGLRLTF